MISARTSSHSRPFTILAAAVAMLALALGWSRPARAHEAGLSRGDYQASGETVTATLIFAARDVVYVVRTLDANRDGALDAAELDAARVALDAAFAKRLSVRGDGAACPSALAEVAPLENDAVRMVVKATCAATPKALQLDAGFLGVLPFGHRHLAHAVDEPPAGGARDAALTLSKRTFAIAPKSAEAAKQAPPSAPRASGSFLAMGIEHIATGWDHLAFLLGLAVVGRRLRELAIVVTAFTLGHSLSLAVATLGLWVPSARIVEPLIAASIVFVGVENLLRDEPSRRWRLTLPFGLVHGFGFASALREAAVPRAQLPWALVLFNLGVEIGQLVALAIAWPILARAAASPRFRTRGVRLISAAIALAGLVWLVQRVFFV
jgi:hydrogenase/urease accessory protein HupE